MTRTNSSLWLPSRSPVHVTARIGCVSTGEKNRGFLTTLRSVEKQAATSRL
jgi:hypothetical protein